MKSAAIKNSPWAVAIGGFRDADVSDPRRLVTKVTKAVEPQVAQLFDAGMVAGFEHLHMASVNAASAIGGGYSISKSIATETMLRIAAVDQITKAIEAVGVNPRTRAVALIVFAPTVADAQAAYSKASALLGREDDSALGLDEAKYARLKEWYDVGDEELEAAGGRGSLVGLIVERGALLSLRR